jgi:hypothetical protein
MARPRASDCVRNGIGSSSGGMTWGVGVKAVTSPPTGAQQIRRGLVLCLDRGSNWGTQRAKGGPVVDFPLRVTCMWQVGIAKVAR